MSLIRGLKSKHPCPICLVSADKLSDGMSAYPIRSAQEAQDLVRRTADMTAQDRNELLKNVGLRPVEVSVILISQALSTDIEFLRMYFGSFNMAMYTEPLVSTVFTLAVVSLITYGPSLSHMLRKERRMHNLMNGSVYLLYFYILLTTI